MNSVKGCVKAIACSSCAGTRCHFLILLTALVLAGCGESATLIVKQGQGERPELPPPDKTLFPTVNIAPAGSWPQGAAPIAATGLQVNRFAEGLDHPRWLYVLPNGDVLVAESNAQQKPPRGIRGRIMALVMKRAGAGVPSADRITLLRDADRDGTAEFQSVFLSDLTSPFGMDWQPDTGALWVAVNERDEIGSDLVPDYMTSVKRDGFYGWPYSYFGQHIDTRVEPQRPDLVASALVPDYALGPHTASLGLAFHTGDSFPENYRHGVFVGQHGSWNRKPRSGYKVIFVPFEGGMPAGKPEDILTGFVSEQDQAMGRPVDVAVDSAGALLTTDDVGNIVWRATPADGS